MTTASDYLAMLQAAKQAGDKDAVAHFRKSLQTAQATEDRQTYNPAGGMSTTQKVLGNVAGGVADLGHGVKQSMGMESGQDYRERVREQAPLREGVRGGGLARGVGMALPAVAASFVPGLQTVPGAAFVGAMQGGLAPTEDDNVGLSKARNAALGAVTGGVAQKYLPVAAAAAGRGLAKTRDALVRQGVGTQASRANLAGRQFAGQFDNPSAVPGQLRQGLADEVPGVTPTVGQITGNRDVLGAERTAWGLNNAAGNRLKAQAATNNAARHAYLDPLLDRDPAAIGEAASAQFGRAREGLTLKPGGVDEGGALTGPTTKWAASNPMESPTAQAKFAEFQGRLQAIAKLPENQQLEALHQFRRGGINDFLAVAHRESSPQTIAMLRRPVQDLKDTLDEVIQQRTQGGDWKGMLRDYSAGKLAQSQAAAGQGVLQKLGTAAPLSSGESALTSRAQYLRDALKPSNLTNARYGTAKFAPDAESGMARTLASIERQQKAWAPDVGPAGSSTAENVRALRNIGENPVTLGNLGAASVAGAAGHPLAAAAVMTQRWMANRAQQDIGKQLLELYANPTAAAQAIEQLGLPPGAKSKLLADVARAAGRAVRASVPAGVVGVSDRQLSAQ